VFFVVYTKPVDPHDASYSSQLPAIWCWSICQQYHNPSGIWISACAACEVVVDGLDDGMCGVCIIAYILQDKFLKRHYEEPLTKCLDIYLFIKNNTGGNAKHKRAMISLFFLLLFIPKCTTESFHRCRSHIIWYSRALPFVQHALIFLCKARNTNLHMKFKMYAVLHILLKSVTKSCRKLLDGYNALKSTKMKPANIEN